MDDRNYIIILYDYYGDLFNEKQKEYFEQYYFDNLSLQEIGDNLKISRNAIHKSIKSIVNKLYFYEDKLKLYYKTSKILDIIDSCDNLMIRDEIKNILEDDCNE